MHKGRGGHDCQVDTTRLGLWHCADCGQDWEIRGVAGHEVTVKKISRVARFIISLLG